MADEYYGASADAFLFIGTSTATPLPADGADTFTEVPLLGTITPAPSEISAGSFKILNDNASRSVGGRQQEQNVPGSLRRDASEEVHTRMKADSQVGGGRKRNWRLVRPDGTMQKFRGFVNQWTEAQFDAEQDPPLPHNVDFNIRVDGAVTEA